MCTFRRDARRKNSSFSVMATARILDFIRWSNSEGRSGPASLSANVCFLLIPRSAIFAGTEASYYQFLLTALHKQILIFLLLVYAFF